MKWGEQPAEGPFSGRSLLPETSLDVHLCLFRRKSLSLIKGGKRDIGIWPRGGQGVLGLVRWQPESLRCSGWEAVDCSCGCQVSGEMAGNEPFKKTTLFSSTPWTNMLGSTCLGSGHEFYLLCRCRYFFRFSSSATCGKTSTGCSSSRSPDGRSFLQGRTLAHNGPRSPSPVTRWVLLLF